METNKEITYEEFKQEYERLVNELMCCPTLGAERAECMGKLSELTMQHPKYEAQYDAESR